jgi:hypothetical protein
MRLSYIHQAYGYSKNDIPCGGSNPGPSGRESSAITARPGSPSDFCSLFKVRHVIGCTNHDIVVGLCSELFMRLSYYKMESTAGIEPTPVWAGYRNHLKNTLKWPNLNQFSKFLDLNISQFYWL